MSKKVFNAVEGKFPFSHAVEASGKPVYISGQPSMDLATGKFVDGTFKEQFLQCFKNLDAVLKAAGLTRDDVVKCTVFLVDMRDYPEMNELYSQMFQKPFPSRSCFACAGLPLGTRVEIEMIAYRND